MVIDRLFCPRCGKGAYDCTGEGDFRCIDDNCAPSRVFPFITPIREHSEMARELVRLTLENERLKAALAEAIK